MTIRRGEPWGSSVRAPEEFTVFDSDSALARHSGDTSGAVRAGDLWCALGRPPVVKAGQACTEVQIDALEIRMVRADGSSHRMLAVSSVEVGRWFSRSGYVAVLNTGFLRGRNLTPRSHPNDGRFEVLRLSGKTAPLQRLLILRKSSIGAHLPHPGISVLSNSTVLLTHDQHRGGLRVDGVRVGPWKSVEVTALADHWRLML